MATDFFERQAAARRSTAWLIAMFLLAVVGIVGSVFGITLAAAEGSFEAAGGAAFGTLALIAVGSLFKVVILRSGGGRGVAESLGGQPILHDTARSPAERVLLNVVDEMAIASGTPTPPVFLLEDRAINAFAAGYSPSDAVIGVTRGCVESLTRDELQGVVAHEFSHILNGDMRMSIRLIGVLHGILLLGLIGRLLLRVVFHSGGDLGSRRSGGDSGKGGTAILAVLAIGAAMVVIGAIGSLMGGLIKAAVSRQREYLADASAVQFTRNPDGIAGALKRIAATARGGRLRHPRAAEVSHMYFAQGVWEGFTSLMATHPPLPKRIRAIQPHWDGSLPEPGALAAEVASERGSMGFAGGGTAVPVAALDAAVDRIGEPEEAHRQYARELIAAIPGPVRDAAGEPCGARAVVYGLLLDQDPKIRERQREALAEHADAAVVDLLFRKIAPLTDELDARLRLPLVDLTVPSLAAMSSQQYQRFSRSFRALVLADERLGLFEWTLAQVLMRHLRPKFERVRSPRVHYSSLYALNRECGVVLSAIATTTPGQGPAAAAYAAGRAIVREAPPAPLERSECGLSVLREALEKLCQAPAIHRGRLVDGAAAVICEDDRVTVAEAELLRGIADLLDCPMPPLLPGQRLAAP